MTEKLTRRDVFSGLAISGAALAAAGAAAPLAAVAAGHEAADRERPFLFCLNTSTIRGQNLPLAEQVELTAKAGYDAIEPWVRDIQAYVEGGGDLAELRRRIEDLGLSVENAVGFPNWVVDDDEARRKGLDQLRREMELVAAIGCQRVAVPPVGVTRQPDLDLRRAAERYRAALEIGDQTGVVPQVEHWGPSAALSRLGEIMFVAIESGHPQACILPDVYHIYKSRGDFHGLKLIDGRAIGVFHMNDYPADPPRETIGDADRIYPGDGVAPLGQILRDLYLSGFRGAISLELFNRTYWQQDPLDVARTGLQKMKDAVAAALA